MTILRIACAFALALLVRPAWAGSQTTRGNVVVSNGTTCTTLVPTVDADGNLTGTSSTTSPCSAFNGEYLFQTFPSGPVPQIVTYIPQVVDGGAWQTTIVLANLTASPASASLACYQETGAANGATQSWNPPFKETVNTQNISLAPGGTLFLDTPGTNPNLTEGWCAVTASDGVQSHAVFSFGYNNSQGTAPAAGSWSDILVPVDNSNGSLTAVAVANPSSSSQIVTVSFQSTNGAISQATFTAQPMGHNAFQLAELIPSSAGQRGLAEIVVSGSVSAVGLQFNPTLNFTTAQNYSISNGPVIGALDPSTCMQNPQTTGCKNPATFLLTLTANFMVNGGSYPLTINITPGAVGYNAGISGMINGQMVSGSLVEGDLTGAQGQITWSFTSSGPQSTFNGGMLTFVTSQTGFDSKIGEAVGTFSGQLLLNQANVGGGLINGTFTEITPIWYFLWLVDIQ